MITKTVMVLGKQGRVDDNIETIRKRFKVFVESSIPVVDYYETSGKVKKVLKLFSSQPTMFSNAILVCAVG
jgi:adenylate kinase family enzyme